MVVTRARAQASELVDRLAGLGATVVELPVIAIEDPADGGAALAGRRPLAAGAYRVGGVHLGQRRGPLLAALGDRAVAPVGPMGGGRVAATARTLARGRSVRRPGPRGRAWPRRWPRRSRPAAPRTGTGGRRAGTVLFPRAERCAASLAAGLRAKGWLVDEVVAYRTVAGRPGPDDRGRPPAGPTRWPSPRRRPSSAPSTSSAPTGVPPVVVSIGPVTSATARAAGLAVAAEAIEHTIDGLVAALVAALGADGAGAG